MESLGGPEVLIHDDGRESTASSGISARCVLQMAYYNTELHAPHSILILLWAVHTLSRTRYPARRVAGRTPAGRGSEGKGLG